MEIRLLQPSDDRARFRSGDVDLDRFLERYAGQNQFRHHVGTTYVAVAPGQVEIDDLPGPLRRKLPSYPLPVLRIARLAVDEAARGQGVGKLLLRFALELPLRLSREFGCVGAMVDTKPSAVGFYENLGFIPIEVLETNPLAERRAARSTQQGTLVGVEATALHQGISRCGNMMTLRCGGWVIRRRVKQPW
jgi:GNAT superfamily N-acetyltransferase